MKSTFMVSFYLRTGRVSKKGEAAVMVSITINGNRERFNSKLSVSPELWDAKSGRAKGRTAEANNLNRLMDGIRSRITTIYNEQINAYGYTSAEKVKNNFLGVGDESKLLVAHFFPKFIAHYQTRVGITTSDTTFKRYLRVKSCMVDFLKDKSGHVCKLLYANRNTKCKL